MIVGATFAAAHSDFQGKGPRIQSRERRSIESVDLSGVGDPLFFPDSAVDYLRANPAYTIDRFPLLAEPPAEELARAYQEGRIAGDWRNLRRHLPNRAESVLDIGSGIGAIDVLLYRALDRPRLTLVDRAKRTLQGRDFDVLRVSREFFDGNDVPDSKARWIDARDPAALGAVAADSYDLVLSLRGLGYLFPYELYRGAIRSSIAPGGELILDARKMETSRRLDAAGHAELEAAGVRDYRALEQLLMRDFRSLKRIGEGVDRVRLKASGKQ